MLYLIWTISWIETHQWDSPVSRWTFFASPTRRARVKLCRMFVLIGGGVDLANAWVILSLLLMIFFRKVYTFWNVVEREWSFRCCVALPSQKRRARAKSCNTSAWIVWCWLDPGPWVLSLSLSLLVPVVIVSECNYHLERRRKLMVVPILLTEQSNRENWKGRRSIRSRRW